MLIVSRLSRMVGSCTIVCPQVLDLVLDIEDDRKYLCKQMKATPTLYTGYSVKR